MKLPSLQPCPGPGSPHALCLWQCSREAAGWGLCQLRDRIPGSCTALQPDTDPGRGCKALAPKKLFSVLPAQPAFPLSLPPSRAPGARRLCLSPAGLCRAPAPGQSCLSAALPLPGAASSPGAQPSSAAQQQPRQHFPLALGAPARCPWGSRGTCCQTAQSKH